MLKERLYYLNEELDRLSRQRTKVMIHMTSVFNFVGYVEKVEQDFIRCQQTEMDTPNVYVSIPMDKIIYIREIKKDKL